jgi:hypothetical protein
MLVFLWMTPPLGESPVLVAPAASLLPLGLLQDGTHLHRSAHADRRNA